MLRMFIAHVFCLLLVIPSFASVTEAESEKLPEKYRRWLEEEVTYIISKVERETFLELETESERDAFIDAFWRRRDTNPSTLENEYLDEHYTRLAYVNEFFGRDTFRPGWQTDRGRYFIILGPPTDRQDFLQEDSVYPTELWFYNKPELKQYGLPPFFYLLFFSRHGAGELELYSPSQDGPRALMTGYHTVSQDFRQDIEETYNELWEISPELAQASISFRTDEGDIVQFQTPSFGTLSLMEQIRSVPLRGVDTSYAERFYAEKGTVESDYLFSYAPSWGESYVLPGPGDTHYVHWVIEVDPQSIALVKDPEKGLYGTMFIVSLELVSRDNPNKILGAYRRESFMRITEGQAQIGVQRPFSYSGMMPAVPGSYDLHVILRNRACSGREESTCRKSYTVLDSAIEVPGRDPASRPHLTPLILAHGTEHPGGQPVYRAFRLDNLQILPNPRRAFAIGDEMVAVIDTRNAGEGHSVRFRILNRESQEIVSLDKTVSLDGFRLIQLVQEFSLEAFTGGRYRLQVDLLDADGTRLDTKTSDFDVTPRTAVARPFLRGSWPLVSPEIPGVVEMCLGEQYLNLGDKAEARGLFENSIEANPRFGPAREALSHLLLEEGSSDRVIELLAPIFESDPSRFEVTVLLGEAYFQKKDYTRTVELLEKAITLRQPDARTLNVLASSHYQLGERPRARELLERSLSLQPDQPEIRELLEKIGADSAGSLRPPNDG